MIKTKTIKFKKIENVEIIMAMTVMKIMITTVIKTKIITMLKIMRIKIGNHIKI